MRVPIVPYVPTTTVVNKEIVYSDTVLSAKDLGKELKTSSISGVYEFALESCLTMILKSNPNVIFDTIQYSEKDKKVYFYTTKDISKQAWEETYEPINYSYEILKQIKDILSSERNKENDCISLYDVAKLIKTKNHEYAKMKDSYENRLKYIIRSKYRNSSDVLLDFSYGKKELIISFKKRKDWQDIVFSKKSGDLYIKRSESSNAQNILTYLCDDLSELYDEFIKYSGFITQYNYRFESTNTDFLVNVSKFGVAILVQSPLNKYMDDFKLMSRSFKNQYSYDCNSGTLISALRGNEDELFKRIFVKIDDCPEWSKPILYEIRSNQLMEEQKNEEERKHQEMKKQKRLELRRKIFPFLNK